MGDKDKEPQLHAPSALESEATKLEQQEKTLAEKFKGAALASLAATKHVDQREDRRFGGGGGGCQGGGMISHSNTPGDPAESLRSGMMKDTQQGCSCGGRCSLDG